MRRPINVMRRCSDQMVLVTCGPDLAAEQNVGKAERWFGLEGEHALGGPSADDVIDGAAGLRDNGLPVPKGSSQTKLSAA